MLEYFEGKLCIPKTELVERGVMSDSNYKALSSRKKLKVARQGKGLGNYALVIVDSLPDKYKSQVQEIYPNGDRIRLLGWLRQNYETDQNAMAFFMSKEQCGVELKTPKVMEYVNNASVMNTCIKLYNNAKLALKLMGKEYDWSMMSATIEGLREEFHHTLPASTLRFRKKVAEYKRGGYASLISGKFGNQSARKVDHKTERLILSLAVQPNRPFNSNVHDMYQSFVCGEIEVYDPETGELFNPDDFTDKNGGPKELSEATICNYMNKPSNQVLIKHTLMQWSTFMHEEAPHVHRHSGDFSFSQITMDDVDLPRKLKDSKDRVHAYYAYDVVSQCRVGIAYSRGKDDSLVVDCFRDMFRLIERNGWGLPAGIEVENHLMTKYKEGFLKAGNVFKFVRFCAPLNSQDKFAEPLNGAFKRSIEHKNHAGIGRWYAKDFQYRTESKKISDETNTTFEEYEYYSWDQLVAENRADCAEWNNTLHPNQKKYPGMTRWDVLVANINPTLLPYDKMRLSQYIGEQVQTSIRRNSTVRVCHEDWWLGSTKDLERLEPNNYKVTACYLPDEDGKPTDVYLFQNEKFISKVERVETFSRVMAEQTEEDKQRFTEQQKKISSFRKYLSDNAIEKVGVQKPSTTPIAEPEDIEIKIAAPELEEETFPTDNFAVNALEDI